MTTAIWNIFITLLIACWIFRVVAGGFYGLWLYKKTDHDVQTWSPMDGLLVGSAFWIGLVLADGIRWIWNKAVAGV